jgi:UDP-glucuronate 4-epimerase
MSKMLPSKDRPILVTGTAGFIGCHLALRLLQDGFSVVGLDNVNSYYDVQIKHDRTRLCEASQRFTNVVGDLADSELINGLFAKHHFSHVVHLAAQAGVRYSLEAPHTYIDSNITGFLNILEAARHHKPEHVIFASSSSVYGANTKVPFSEADTVDHPVSLYAATKKANEAMAHSYAHLYDIPLTGLRFFTVYGPWGRPDMAVFKFTKALFERTPLDLYNSGDMLRDFTYVDDIVEGIVRLLPHAPQKGVQGEGEYDPGTSHAPYRIYNIGNNKPEKVTELIALLEKETGLKAIINDKPMQPGDVYATYADTTRLHDLVGFKPNTSLEQGVRAFVQWYRDYFKVGNGPSENAAETDAA